MIQTPASGQEEQPQLLQASPWLSENTDYDKQFFSSYPAHTYKKGHIFYSQEENSDYVYLLCEGRVCLSIDNPNGDAKDIFIADKGFIFGKLSALDCMPNCCYAIGVSDTIIVKLIPKGHFTELLNTDIHFCQYVMTMLTKTVRTLISQIRLITFGSSRARVGYALYHLVNQYSTPYKEERLINITFTHQEIGELIGLSRVSVSNILSQMVKQGILKKKEGYYYVKDIEAIYRCVLDDL